MGEKLKQARLAAGLTQKQLADAVGCKQANIAQYEGEVREPMASTLKKMAQALNKTMDEIF